MVSGGSIIRTTQSPGSNKRITEIQGRLSGRTLSQVGPQWGRAPRFILSPTSEAAAPRSNSMGGMRVLVTDYRRPRWCACGLKTDIRLCPFRADTVEKVLFG